MGKTKPANPKPVANNPAQLRGRLRLTSGPQSDRGERFRVHTARQGAQVADQGVRATVASSICRIHRGRVVLVVFDIAYVVSRLLDGFLIVLVYARRQGAG